MNIKFFVCIFFFNRVLTLNKGWWKHSNMYEIYTPSYMDTNGDGWGDLKGITSKLDYLKNLGIDTIYLTPFHPSPMLDTGYDVSNYLEINPLHGTLADFHELIRQLKKKKMKLIMDLVINHSSDQHEWFKKSIDRIEPYTDYYIWRDPKGYDNESRPIEPNNWCCILGASAWTWNEKRKQFYYHRFLPQQPDLNYRNPKVVNEMKKIIKFWLNKGVAGMRLDAAMCLFEDPLFEDEEPLNEADKGKKVGCFQLKHTKTDNYKDNFSFIRQIRAYVDELSAKTNTFERIIILEVFGDKREMMEYYGNASHPGGHYAFNFNLDIQFDYLNVTALNSIIGDWMDSTPEHSAFNWLVGSHDRFRVSFKFIQEYVNVLLALISTLPGIIKLYYGEEIGMTSGIVGPHQRLYYSEYARTPMQWNSSFNAGFSSNSTTWLPVNPNYWKLNVKNQQSDSSSVFSFVKSLLALRNTEAIKSASFYKLILKEWVYVLKRSFKDENFIVVLNLGTEMEEISLDSHLSDLPTKLKLCLSTPNSGFKEGVIVLRKKKRSFVMKPMSAVILCPETNFSDI